MRLVFISNFLNHHQVPVAEELHRRLGDDYRFISTMETPDSFLKIGYPDCRGKSYNVLAYRDAKTQAFAQRLTDEADVVVIGSSPLELVRRRVEAGKLVLLYSERWFKDFGRHLFSLHRWIQILKYHLPWRRRSNVHVLCASGFLPNDLDFFGLYSSRRYKWGYFTECPVFEFPRIIETRNHEVVDIFWCARFIPWKKWDIPIKAAACLKKAGFNFRLRMAGIGPGVKAAWRLIRRLGLEDRVFLIGTHPNSEVLKIMRESSIFLLTSNRQEGWGAGLNEAMGAGCAVVASDAAGASPYLIRDGENGFLFKSGNVKDLTEKVQRLIDDRDLRVRFSKDAYMTMQNLWSPKIAAERLITLCEKLLCSQETPFVEGPCSKAEG